MKKKCSIVLLMIILSTAFAQERFCNGRRMISFHASEESNIRIYPASDYAIEIINEIVDKMGLSASTFEVWKANVRNAVATNCNRKRYILYNEDFLDDIYLDTGSDWGDAVILAHEIGHHLLGHPISERGSSPDIELQADEFAGFVLYKMDAALEDVESVFSTMSNRGSSTHPGRRERIRAITRGWRRAQSQDGDSRREDRSSSNTGADITIAYRGDMAGCGLSLSMKIGEKSFTPNNNIYVVSGLEEGYQDYMISGQISCMATMTACQAFGSGQIDVEDGQTFYVVWANVAYGQCAIELSEY